MKREESHIPEEDLLLAIDGELAAIHLREHLASCSACRERLLKLEGVLDGFAHAYRRDIDPELPPAAVSRAKFRARLAEAARAPQTRVLWRQRLAYAGAAAAVVILAVSLGRTGPAPDRFLPDLGLTPGLTRPVTEAELCTAEQSGSTSSVPRAVALQVFSRYGISEPGHGAYELDFLVSPELGGAEDVRNLWPQSYSTEPWNAHAKDALEDHLQRLVCQGSLDLATAQGEMATDWIAAYKKYFRSDAPLALHARFLKDRPWE